MLLAGFAIFNLPIHFLLGWIADFVNKPKLVAICIALGFIAVLPMLWSNSLWALWFFTALYPVLDASIPVYWASVGDFFGRVLGPVIAGAVYDRTQSYTAVLIGMAVALLISAVLTALLIKPWAALRQRPVRHG